MVPKLMLLSQVICISNESIDWFWYDLDFERIPTEEGRGGSYGWSTQKRNSICMFSMWIRFYLQIEKMLFGLMYSRIDQVKFVDSL